MSDSFVFHRTKLASAFCDSLEGKGIHNAASGLFLAGPRRVGKSTFLTGDLIPEAERRGWLSVYVDLWSDKLNEPAVLISDAIKNAILAHKNKLGKIAAKLKLKKISLLKAIELDVTKPGLPDHVTLADALTELSEMSAKPILLVIDEAQHALTTDKGLNAMFAIKSARDQMNQAGRSPQLMLVLTGSNRDKLAQLVVKKDQPFFGSSVTAFPLLGYDFAEAYTQFVNNALSVGNQFEPDAMYEAFELSGYRPEILQQIVGKVALSNEAASLSLLLTESASLWQNQLWIEFENDFTGLPPIQRAILRVLVEQGSGFSPFSEPSMDAYADALNQESVPTATIQTAINQLRDKGYLWQSGRGSYALEDENFASWYLTTQSP